MSGVIKQIQYYIRENETTKRFFNPKLFIVPGGLVLIGIILASDTIFRYTIFILFFEWICVFLFIVYKQYQKIIHNQEKIMTLLDEKG